MDILTNKKAVEHCLVYMEHQEPYYTCHLRSQKNGNYSSHRHKSLSTLQQRNPRTPKNMSLPILKKNSHSTLPPRASTTVLVSISFQCSPILPKNPQQDGQPFIYRSTYDNPDSLQPHNLISDHLLSTSNSQNRRST